MVLFDGNHKNTTQNAKEDKSIFGPVLSVFGLPVDRNIIFSNHKGVYKKKIEKRQRNLIIKISFLKFFLHCDENILLLTTGYSPMTFWELLLTFPAFFFFKRTLLVFTTKRIFHIPTTYRYKYRQTLSQIRYEDCHSIAIKGRSMVLDLKNGERQIFSRVRPLELKKIKYLIGHFPIEEGLKPDTAIHWLCPSCSNGLSFEPKACPKCQLKFKDKAKVILSSILLPGGGFFYSRHHFYGVLMAFIEMVIMFSLVLSGMNLKKVYSQNNLFLLILAIMILISVKAINIFHSNTLMESPLPTKTHFKRRKV
jgi:hypothetical protein